MRISLETQRGFSFYQKNMNEQIKEQILVFSTQKYAYFREAFVEKEKAIFEKGKLEHKVFPDGESYYRILSKLQSREAVLIGGTVSENDTMELYDLASGLVDEGVKKLTIIIPFYGYSTMERTVKSGEIVTAKTRARLLSAIPQSYSGNRIVMVDLHVSGLQYYFERGVHTVHLYAKPLILEAARKLGGKDFVLASADAGRAKWVESLAFDLGVDAAFVYKRRSSGSDTEITGINADVNGKKVVLYDDMIRTGGSLINAVKVYKEAGAKEIYVVATHGVFPNGSVERLENSKLIEKIIVTDTHSNAKEAAQKTDFIEISSISDLLIDAVTSF
ncbi:ribose-phosphate pyrophosphokinase [Bernardetia litoralis DSM 6794]|uniref:ribose-phosphate diphosphokinase n=2 Tax=Bernardetia litoralis TaxID=999 RepID=I4AQ75_BERLS|nr:ribose-phosphate pyrophosphokinase [Bernardetia litoralis DSM 6794]